MRKGAAIEKIEKEIEKLTLQDKLKLVERLVHQLRKGGRAIGHRLSGGWLGKLYKGTHPAIVSPELYEAVQSQFEKHNKPKIIQRKNFAFAGLLKCGRCGCSITAEIKKGKYIYYRCTGFRGRCGEPYLREEVLAERLGEVVKAIQIDQDKLGWVKKALKLSHFDLVASGVKTSDWLGDEDSNLDRQIQSLSSCR